MNHDGSRGGVEEGKSLTLFCLGEEKVMMPFLMRKSHDGGWGGGGAGWEGKGKGKGKGSPKFWDLQYDMTETKRKGKNGKAAFHSVMYRLGIYMRKARGRRRKEEDKKEELSYQAL